MGRVFRLIGREEDALNSYIEALESCPENPELLTTVGLLFLKLGNNTKAFEYLGNSLTYDPKSAKTILAAGSIIQDNQVRVAYRNGRSPIYRDTHLYFCFAGYGCGFGEVSCGRDDDAKLCSAVEQHRYVLLRKGKVRGRRGLFEKRFNTYCIS